MKYSVLFLLTLCCWSSLVAQSSDSLTIRIVDSLIEVAYQLTSETEFRNALDVNAEAERIALESFGQESIPYGECCSNRGRIYSRGGQYREAELWYQKALNIQEIVLGKEDPEYASTLNRLAIIYFKLGDFISAKALFIQSGNIRKRTLGENHPDYASSLVNLANVSMSLAELEQAVPVYKEAKNIFEHSVGTMHPHYATCLMNLAGLYCDMGQYLEAEPLYIEACSIYEKKFGQVHPDYAMCLNNLSTLYQEMANIEKAYSLRVQATAIYKEMLGNEHPDYAWSLSLLAYTSLMLNHFEEAESLYLEVRTIIGHAFGKNHTRYARSLSSLGTLYRQTGRYEEAQQLLEEAKAIVGMALGKEHIEYARILTSLALIDSHRGQYEKAESKLVESRAILENVLGRNHMMYARSVTNLAVLYAYMDMPLKSGPFFQELSTINQRMISRAIFHLSGQEMIQYVSKYSETYHQMLSFLWMSEHRDLIPTCYDNCLFYKGFLLQSSDCLKRLARSNELTADKYGRLKGLHRRLAAQYSRSVATRDTNLVVVLEHEANNLEKELARDVASFGNALQQVTWREVQAALPADGIAVEFVHFSNQVPARKDGIQYAAFVLRPGSRMPEFIPLFEEEELDHLLQNGQERKADYVNDLYAWSDRGLIQSDQNKRTLYELIWSKIETNGLSGIRTVYYSPTGVLHRINLGAIPLDETTVLSDRYNMIELNSTRQLGVPESVARSAWNALLVGGVQFEADPAKLNPNEETLAFNRSISTVWTEAGPRQGTWSPLPWTWKEVEAISTTLLSSNFNVIKYSGSVATEEAIKAVGIGSPSPRVLHLATHGYFFPDPDVGQEDPGLEENEPTFKASDNPMIRSGLILAGGNHAWQTGKPVQDNMEDGILTAYEISQMDLSNTELVVLSACETGLGDIEGNEGVYGLQRAFKIAGAKYLIMSLWQVPDRETMQFMTTFYRNWLEPGDGQQATIPDAFRKTQLEMRDRFFNPYGWAGFVLVE